MINDFISTMEEAITVLQNYPAKEILLFHHNDTDGISSGTILINAFSAAGYKVSHYPLEKPYPQILEKVFLESNQIIVFSDFAGKIAPLISQLNNKRNLVLILDHHPAEPVSDNHVFNLDGEFFNLKGDQDISASATCYLFAKTMYRLFSLKSNPMPHLGVLGAIGDGFFVNGALSGINRQILQEAEDLNVIRTEIKSTGEEYFILLGGKEYEAENICKTLDTLGGVGYSEDGVSAGIQVCNGGLTPDITLYAEKLDSVKNKIFMNEIKNIKNNLITTKNLQWLNVENRFSPMGIKMIGVFLTEIKDAEFVDRRKYLAGFQQIPDFVPGFGEIEFNSTKISMRVSEYLVMKIRNSEIRGLNSFLPAATEKIGGFSDACHRLSAATTIRKGQEQELIDEIEKLLANEGDLV